LNDLPATGKRIGRPLVQRLGSWYVASTFPATGRDDHGTCTDASICRLPDHRQTQLKYAVRFRLLGPVTIEVDNAAVTLPRRRERCLLAILLLEAGRTVPVERMIELLWDDELPDNGRRALHSHVARIRSVLARAGAAEHGVSLESSRKGYTLTVDAERVDAHRFRALVARATTTAELSERDRLLREALELWRGPALHNAASERLRQRLCADLEELRLHALEESFAVGLALQRHRQLLAELGQLTGEHPTRERLVELYMIALYRSGRTSDALDVYARAGTRLREELGLDPGAALQRLHQAILRGEPISATDDRAAQPTTGHVRPAQLPADCATFSGRIDELRNLDATVRDRAGTIVISAIAGTAGVGKTTLAVRWAHQMAHRFPDGQLYVNLRGFDPGGLVTTAAEAVRGFLDALQVPPQRIPAGLDAQTALYRSLLAGKRVLVLLDNARDAGQARPLLPGAHGCLAVVTSRNRLTGLVASDSAISLELDVMSPGEARQLLSRRIGAERIAAEPQAVDDIIARCARLPLALAIVAARAITDPQLGLGTLADDLRSLDALAGDDEATDLRTVFSWSYRALSPAAARLFRLLGLHPGPDVSTPAAASLTATPLAQVGSLLAELTRAHLITEETPGRYAFHDLLRAYAMERADAEDSDGDRHAARHRLVDHYLLSAHAAHLLIQASHNPITVGPGQPDVSVEQPGDREQATAWFAAERQVLLAVIGLAAEAGFDEHSWKLAWTVWDYFNLQGYWRELLPAGRIALQAAVRAADIGGQGLIHRGFANFHVRLGEYEQASAHALSALGCGRAAGDPIAQGHSHRLLAWIQNREGDDAQALRHAEAALELYREAGYQAGQAHALNAAGWYLNQLGEHRRALAYCRQALALHEEIAHRPGQAATLDSIGYIHHQLGEYPQAIATYHRALEAYRDYGERYFEAETLDHLGDSHRQAGDLDAARAAWRQAVGILEDLGHADAQQIGAKLRAESAAAAP
jgi:DNA-binding SARP family transcriptional activator/tetratricopeptide (TPR) repeat protein